MVLMVVSAAVEIVFFDYVEGSVFLFRPLFTLFCTTFLLSVLFLISCFFIRLFLFLIAKSASFRPIKSSHPIKQNYHRQLFTLHLEKLMHSTGPHIGTSSGSRGHRWKARAGNCAYEENPTSHRIVCPFNLRIFIRRCKVSEFVNSGRKQARIRAGKQRLDDDK